MMSKNQSNSPKQIETMPLSFHEWELVSGSNITHKCKKSGILGHKIFNDLIMPNRGVPYNGDCDMMLMDHVMSS